MEEILELAANLGKRVAVDSRARRLHQARTSFEGNLEARQLISDYEHQQQRIAELEYSGRPIEPEEKRRLTELHQKVTANAVLKELLKAQADYVELMTLISERIEREALGEPLAPEA
jgi:cell fate (sporulation/competence/biofilm development) regulator YlbF (YheA/YmcA/DUF963 family)